MLIPKKEKPTKLSDLKLITLYNVLYKIIVKALVKRFKHIPPQIILKSQGAFIPDRLIRDSFMVAFEICHHLERKRQGKHGLAALKLDISKVFDQMEWNFFGICWLI